MAFNTYYYALEGGDFSAFLRHFTKQAKGDRSDIINNNNKRKNGTSRIIVIDTTPDKATTTTGKDVPKIEVVSPNEAIRRRAESEIKSEEINTLQNQNGNHSASLTRKRRMKLNKKASVASNIKVKRAKDAFDS